MIRFPLISCLFAALTVVCCGGTKDQPEPSGKYNLSLSEESLSTDYGAHSWNITVTSDCDWGVSSGARDWCTVSPSGGISGKSVVTVTLTENKTGVARETVLTFRYGSLSKTVPVRQGFQPEDIDDGEIIAPEGYTLVWHDEFDSGSDLSSDWTHEVKNSGWVNNELQNYVDRVTPFGDRVTSVSGGALRINCLKASNSKVYSGRVYAKRNTGWLYGYFEARIKLPRGRGTWPAFWMMPVQFTSWPADGEIDIMEEVGNHPDYTSSSIHCQAYYHTIGTQKTHEQYTAGAEGKYHVYACEWTPDALHFFVDGKHHFTFENDGTGNKDTWPFNAPFYPILNLAWGGDWGGAQGVDESALPVTMSVDYIRVFQKQ